MKTRVKDRNKSQQSIEQLLFLLFIILLWQLSYWILCSVFKVWKSYAMPSPLGVWKCFLRLASDGTIFMSIGNSLLRGGVGYLCAILSGGIIGGMIYRIKFLRRNLKPLITGIQTLPSICWVPFSILWFGLTEGAILFVVIMGSAFSMAIAFEQGITNIPAIYKRAARTMGASDWQLFWKVTVPAGMPELVGGLKQGWAFAWRALMSGEVMTTSVGLGQTLVTGRSLGDIDQIMLVMLTIVGVGIAIEHLVFGRIEKRIKKSF